MPSLCRQSPYFHAAIKVGGHFLASSSAAKSTKADRMVTLNDFA
jgi:hypothetical protein